MNKKPAQDFTATKYPDQGGNFEKLVKYCMRWQRYPNRPLAVVSCHALVSVLGGRVYSYRGDNGIVYTSLVTGPSTSGKGSIKLFCIHMLDNFDDFTTVDNNGRTVTACVDHSVEFMGPHSFTSARNIYESLKDLSGSALCVFTESGHSGQSKAGDLANVALYELELATEHGEIGKILPKGQNEKIPTLFSPAVTIIRESNFEFQRIADARSKSAISGMEGRRSRVNIGSNRAKENRKREMTIPSDIKATVKELYARAAEEKRHVIDEPCPVGDWVYIDIEDEDRLFDFSDEWNVLRGEYLSKVKDHYTATFYGRLKQRVMTYGARLAVMEDPKKPVLTNEMVDIAIKSLENEMKAYGKLKDISVDSWDEIISTITDFFTGNMFGKNKIADKRCGKAMLESGACNLTAIKRGVLKGVDNYQYMVEKHGDKFDEILIKKLAENEIFVYSRFEAMKFFRSRRGVIFYRKGGC